MKSGKQHLTDGMELPNQDKIRKLVENETNKYLGILEAYATKRVEMKRKLRKNILEELESNSRQNYRADTLSKEINTCAVPLVRYLGSFLKWTWEELKQMDQRTRKLITMHKALYPRHDVDRLYVSRKEGGRIGSIEDSVDAAIQWLEDYIEQTNKDWLQQSETILTTRWSTEWQ